MKIILLKNWSDQAHHPRKGQIHKVVDVVCENGEIEYYKIFHNGSIYSIYPYECSVEGATND